MFQPLRAYKAAISIALALTLTELFVELLQPYIISKIIDDGIVASNLSNVWKWGGVLFGLTLVSFLAGITNSFYSSHVSQSFGYDLREKLYEKVQAFTFSMFTTFPAAGLITRITNDVSLIQNTLFMALRIALRAPLLIIGSLVMSFLVLPGLAIYMLIFVPILAIFLIWVVRKAGSVFRIVQTKLDGVNGMLRESLIGMRLIRAFVRMNREHQRFAGASGDLADRTKAALRITETTMPVILFIMNLSILAVLWFGSKQIQTGDASIGELVAIINYAARMTGALSIMSMIIMGYTRARASAERIQAVLSAEVDLTDSDQPTKIMQQLEGTIAFQRVSFRYPQSQENALTDISFMAKPSEMIAIVGATGSGKTSILQLIPRLYDASSGAVMVDGMDVRELSMKELRGQIGYVPQEPLLFTGTIRENITWGNEQATLDDIMAAARSAQIHETIIGFPDGYDTVLGQRGLNLSGGQKQRISIARALVRKPSILLLDDCTSALDAKTEARLLDALRSYPCVILMVTQKISATLRADHILLLEDGRLLASGPHDALIESSPLYRSIYHSQYGEEAIKR